MGLLDRMRDAQPDPFGLETRGQDGRWLVAVRGEVDLATVGRIENELTRLGSRPIVLDLSGLTFLDSTGLTLLIRTAGRVTIGAVSPPVARLIQTCGLEKELRFAQ